MNAMTAERLLLIVLSVAVIVLWFKSYSQHLRLTVLEARALRGANRSTRGEGAVMTVPEIIQLHDDIDALVAKIDAALLEVLLEVEKMRGTLTQH
jgi:hypothetical protein